MRSRGLGSLASSVLNFMLRQRAHLVLGGGCTQPSHVVLTKAMTQQMQHARCRLCVCLMGLCGDAQDPVGRFGTRGAPIQIPLRVLQSNCGLESFTNWHPCVRAGNLQGLVKQFGPAGAARFSQQCCSGVVHCRSSVRLGNVQDPVRHFAPRVLQFTTSNCTNIGSCSRP